MSTASYVNGLPLLSAELTRPRVGAWRADVDADGEDVIESPVTVNLQGREFVGTVVRSGFMGGRTSARIVGGRGGLSRQLPAKNYSSGVVKALGVLADILRGAGETLAATADATLLSRQLKGWQREEGPVNHALVTLLDAIQASWRILPDGSIWVGVDSYATVDPEHELLDEDWSAGVLTLAVESPDLEPGTTFRGHRIEQVVHRLSRNALRTEAHLTSARSSIGTFLGHIRRHIDYSRQYPCRVSAQNGDGTLQLVPDDVTLKGTGLDQVPIRHGIPGVSRVLVASGTRVHLAFDAGDPTRPFAALWDSGRALAVEFGDDAQDVARKGDSVEVLLPPAVFTGTVNGLAATGVVSWVAPKTVGTIITAGTVLKAGT